MDYLEAALTQLASCERAGYHAQSFAASEPTAWAAQALLAHGRAEAAAPWIEQLLALQNADGSVGITAEQTAPPWPTGLAVLAWNAAAHSAIANARQQTAIDRAVDWLLQIGGTYNEHIDWQGHDTAIQGWPWVPGTHSWLEPTAFNLLALKHTGRAQHPRAREAALLLVNRLLESGGCNYGNTVVFGQELRPHIEPTGLCLLALAGEDDGGGRIIRAIEYLQRELSERTATASLCYGLLGLAAHGVSLHAAHDWLRAAAKRTLARDPGSYKLALVALAALVSECPLIPRVRSLVLAPVTG